MSENRRTSPSFDAESQDIRSFVAAEGEAQKRPSVNLRGAASRSGRPLAQKRQRSGGRSQELLRENEPQSWQRTSQRPETRSRAGGQERLGAQPRVRTQGQRRSGSKAQARTRDRERTESRPRTRTRSQESRPQERLRPQTRARSGLGKASESAKPAVTLSGVVALFSSKPRVIAAAIAALLVLIAIIALPRACASSTPDQAENSADGASTQAAGVSYPEGSSVVSFVAVGDNLPDDFIGFYADKLAGEEEDGTYDYKPLFAHIKLYVEAADLSYINQETHVGGNETGPQGYPSFNTTDEMADAVVDAGFDFVASATNHSYDWGYFGALNHSLSVWEKQPVAFTGTAVTAEQYERIATQTCNGLKFALLNYTYGVNGFTQSELPPYAVNFIDKTRITADVQRAREQEGADVVLVAMHWGTENLTEADDDQKELAQFLADLDVDVVLGSHPHVIGPLEWVKNSNGGGHQTLVAYSLGNFLADHEVPYDINVVEGMLSCDFVREPDSSNVQIQNIKWTPLVCHSTEDRDSFDIYAIDDYPSELAKKNRGLSEKKDPIAWINEQSREIVGPEWFESA